MDIMIYLRPDEIVPGCNDRKRFEPSALTELAASIQQQGLIQPVIVRRIDEASAYEIIAGERRFRACQIAQVEQIPCRLMDCSAEEASAMMLAENTARADLNPIEEAQAYASRMDRFGWTVAQVAEKAGVTTVRVLFRLKLLALRTDLQELIKSGNLPIGYAQILADARLDPNRQTFAYRALRDNPSPTPGWFRQIVSAQAEMQAQELLFDADDFLVSEQPANHSAAVLVDTAGLPPGNCGTPQETLAAHIAFWSSQAAAWAALGKTFKRQECESAARALTFALGSL